MAGQLIQYVVIRADLLKTLNWSVGSVIAQACHACCAVTYLFCNDPHTQDYLKDLDNMHKVVLEASIIFSQNGSLIQFQFHKGNRRFLLDQFY
jgi:peptidyl-tRNA hydrolase